jgi:hypothetical protein
MQFILRAVLWSKSFASVKVLYSKSASIGVLECPSIRVWVITP